MGVVEALLAVVGLVALVAAVVRWKARQDESPVAVDRTAPYREGLHAAVRMQGVAQDLEQQLYTEAVRLSAEAEPSQSAEGERR